MTQKKFFREARQKPKMLHHYVFQKHVGMVCSQCGAKMAEGKELCKKQS